MNKTQAANARDAVEKPPSITAEEFDAKFDAGEDISEYVDWDGGALIEAGELSAGQKKSMQAVTDPEGARRAGNGANGHGMTLEILLPPQAYDQLQSEATRRGMSQEKLAEFFIVQQLGRQRALS